MTASTTILYLHGFLSGPQSLKAQETQNYLKQHYPNWTFLCPTLSSHPSLAIEQLQTLIDCQANLPVLIGSSLGGYYATYLAEKYQTKAALINPAIRPFALLPEYLGPQTNPYTGEQFELTHTHIHALEKLWIETPTAQQYWVFLGTQDETLNWQEAACYFAGSRQSIFQGDNHRLNQWPRCLAAALQWLHQD